MTTTADNQVRDGNRLVPVTINNQTVNVEGPKASGRQIKQAAIDQGVSIELDFELKLIKPNGDRQIIGDDEIITINKNSVFKANAGDDNS